jgi:hypothetical protein
MFFFTILTVAPIRFIRRTEKIIFISLIFSPIAVYFFQVVLLSYYMNFKIEKVLSFPIWEELLLLLPLFADYYEFIKKYNI